MYLLAHVTHNEVSLLMVVALMMLGAGVFLGLQLAYKGLRHGFSIRGLFRRRRHK